MLASDTVFTGPLKWRDTGRLSERIQHQRMVRKTQKWKCKADPFCWLLICSFSSNSEGLVWGARIKKNNVWTFHQPPTMGGFQKAWPTAIRFNPAISFFIRPIWFSTSALEHFNSYSRPIKDRSVTLLERILNPLWQLHNSSFQPALDTHGLKCKIMRIAHSWMNYSSLKSSETMWDYVWAFYST